MAVFLIRICSGKARPTRTRNLFARWQGSAQVFRFQGVHFSTIGFVNPPKRVVSQTALVAKEVSSKFESFLGVSESARGTAAIQLQYNSSRDSRFAKGRLC